MTLYHGTDNLDLILKPEGRSRYGFPAFFGTPNVELAKRYAQYRGDGSGAVYEFKVARPSIVLPWDYRNTYTDGRFRRKVYELYHKGIKSALFTNALDYPQETHKVLEVNDIVVIYEVKLVKDLKAICYI